MTIGRRRVRPAVSTASRSGILSRVPQRRRVVHQQDGVADHDAGQHDDADVGLQAEGVPVSLSDSTTPIDGQRNREHDDERVAQRLVLRRHHRVDQDRWRGSAASGAARTPWPAPRPRRRSRRVKSRGTSQLGELRVDRVDGVAERAVELGVDARDALLVLALDLDRAALVVDPHQRLRPAPAGRSGC